MSDILNCVRCELILIGEYDIHTHICIECDTNNLDISICTSCDQKYYDQTKKHILCITCEFPDLIDLILY
jgi:hypothetical protein